MNASIKVATRTRLMVGVAIVVLGIYALMGVRAARIAANRLSQTRIDFAEVTRKLSEIDRLQKTPKVAALHLESPAEISSRISAARQAAGLPQSSLLKEQPSDPVRLDRSDFELRATAIDLSAATLPQIIAFCDALRDEETGTIVRDITLNEPRNGGVGGKQEKWVAQLVLTQMIFSPKSR